MEYMILYKIIFNSLKLVKDKTLSLYYRALDNTRL